MRACNKLARHGLVGSCIGQIARGPACGVECAAWSEGRGGGWADEVGAAVAAGEAFAYYGGRGDQVG